MSDNKRVATKEDDLYHFNLHRLYVSQNLALEPKTSATPPPASRPRAPLHRPRRFRARATGAARARRLAGTFSEPSPQVPVAGKLYEVPFRHPSETY